MLKLINSSESVSLAIPTRRDKLCPEYKVVSCRIRKARNIRLQEAGEVVANA